MLIAALLSLFRIGCLAHFSHLLTSLATSPLSLHTMLSNHPPQLEHISLVLRSLTSKTSRIKGILSRMNPAGAEAFPSPVALTFALPCAMTGFLPLLSQRLLQHASADFVFKHFVLNLKRRNFFFIMTSHRSLHQLGTNSMRESKAFDELLLRSFSGLLSNIGFIRCSNLDLWRKTLEVFAC